jgi:hypothetical protein
MAAKRNVSVVFADISATLDSAWADRHGLQGSTVITNLDGLSVLKGNLRVTPTTIIVNASGVVVGAWSGALDTKKVAEVSRALSGQT